MSTSAVHFATERRVHIGLAVSKLGLSTQFYQALFDTEPTKTRAGYARFEVSEPPLNLSIIQSGEAQGPADSTSHFGIQLKSTAAVADLRSRLQAAGLTTRTEESVNCCHAIQDKAWVVDPDGHRWEAFVVLDDAPDLETHNHSDCCPTNHAEACCTVGGEPCCSESK